MQGSSDGPEDRWLTFGELATARGISRESAIRLIRKKRWRRQQDNQGRVIALVPADWLVGPEGRPADDPAEPHADPEDAPEDAPGGSPFHTQALAALEGVIVTLGEQLVRAEARADRAEASRQEAITLAKQSVAMLAAERDQLTEVTSRAEQAQAAVHKAEAATRAAEDRAKEAYAEAAETQKRVRALEQADEARKARGRLRRVWAAWRGE
jgi:hypothetical protein